MYVQPHQSQERLQPAPGEVRLDRLVRKPSGEKPPRAKPRVIKNSQSDHFYDTVALDEDPEITAASPPDEVYDNHLLYEEHNKTKSDTIGMVFQGLEFAVFEPKPDQSSEFRFSTLCSKVKIGDLIDKI